MELIWVKLNGFKRFENATLNTTGKVIALLGPNEAGKSSILQALTRLNDDEPLNKDVELTRDKEFNDDDIVIEGAFLLDDQDRQAIADLYEGESVKWLHIKKTVMGLREFEIKLSLPIDVNHYETLLKMLEKFLLDLEKMMKDQYFIVQRLDKNEVGYQVGVEIDSKLLNLMEKLKDLTTKLIRNLQDRHLISFQLQYNFKMELKTVYSTMTKGQSENYLRDCDNFMEILNKIDFLLENADPNLKLINLLLERVPKFLIFNESHRDLRSSFNLSDVDQEHPSLAISNLLKVAGIDIEQIILAQDDQRKFLNLLNKANKKIAEIYKGKWSQSDVKPIIDVHNKVIKIFIENESQDAFDPDHRSDGLRQFVALINFLEAEQADKPILLVDEAELHLHYDAQADLIQMFTQQKFAAKIIYTTHSVGCLPEDLGTGVKLVCPLENKAERSDIKKHFWSASVDKRPGVLPLLFGMGASNLAFMAIRQTVFVEGATDMLLLPTLLRQAVNIDHLGFQIVPGIAETKNADFGLLDNHAPKVVFLVDNDQAGNEYEKQLKESGVEQERIFKLPKLGNLESTVLEDYIRKELYLEAVNKTLETWKKGDIPRIENKDIDEHNYCYRNVEKWFKEKNLKLKEYKVAIAYYLLDLGTEERQEMLITDEGKDKLKELYKSLGKILKIG